MAALAAASLKTELRQRTKAYCNRPPDGLQLAAPQTVECVLEQQRWLSGSTPASYRTTNTLQPEGACRQQQQQ